MSVNSDPRSVPTLISDLAQQVTTLMQTEVRLLRAEMSEKLGQLGSGAAEVAAGAICLLAALLVLLQALVIAIARIGADPADPAIQNSGIGMGWASLIVGVVVAGIGAFLVRNGTKNLSPSNLTPERTQEQLSRDAQVVKEQIR
jgi:hypothetical protein